MATKAMQMIIKDDLAEAKRQGKTYNQMYADTRKEQYKKGMLSKEAYDKGRAYELYTPKEVREVVDKYISPNSRAQYNAEKAAGGALTDLSYEEWKKLD